jgi:glycosyltransferase involved in cell wall biosynthesis
MKIALFDYVTTSSNAVGKCNLGVLRALCKDHDCTVFAVDFENPCPERIRWVRVPCPRRPLVLVFLVFHIMAPLCYLWHRFRTKARFDLFQTVESYLLFGDIVYSHCCHRFFLRRHWRQSGATGLRGLARWMDHVLRAVAEPFVYRRASLVVVPSHGFARELVSTYPYISSKIRVLTNPVDLEAMQRPESFDRDGCRAELQLKPEHIVLAFVALGHYELKGLPLLLEAVANSADPRLRLLVVGGSPDLVAEYRQRANAMGLNGNVRFVGNQKDIRKYLWAADALAHPSQHEVFPLVPLEAAAAGLPLLVTKLNGVEEYFRQGENGLLMQRSVTAVSDCVARFAQMSAQERREMGRRAQADVRPYGFPSFEAAWSQLYREVRQNA